MQKGRRKQRKMNQWTPLFPLKKEMVSFVSSSVNGQNNQTNERKYKIFGLLVQADSRSS
jgi:hypothetical protein